tara:strand:+ start:811 stop:972 length:162 start_codon:yes stop_codon:yes gene_type:complete
MIKEEIEKLNTLSDLNSEYTKEKWFKYSARWRISNKIDELEDLLEIIDDGGES